MDQERLICSIPREGNRLEIWEVERKVDERITERMPELRFFRDGEVRVASFPKDIEKLWRALA